MKFINNYENYVILMIMRLIWLEWSLLNGLVCQSSSTIPSWWTPATQLQHYVFLRAAMKFLACAFPFTNTHFHHHHKHTLSSSQARFVCRPNSWKESNIYLLIFPIIYFMSVCFFSKRRIMRIWTMRRNTKRGCFGCS